MTDDKKDNKISLRMNEEDMNVLEKARKVAKERTGLNLKNSALIRYALTQVTKTEAD